MIDHIANTLADSIRQLPFISLAGGVARAQKMKDGPVSRTLPAVPKGDGTNGYYWLTPNSKETGIAYFENLDNQLSDAVAGGRGQMFKATLRLIVWLNLARITPPDTGAMMSQAVAALVASVADTDFVASVRVVPIREVPRGADVFGKYTYNEAEQQFLMLPYDYFAFDFDVRYVLKSGCHLTNLVKIDPAQC